MMDILERLRAEYFPKRPPLFDEAADEIERLRAELAASQTREAQYLTALTSISEFDPYKCAGPAASHARKMLAIKRDDSILRLYVEQEIGRRMAEAGQCLTNDASRKAALAAERERIAKWFEKRAEDYADEYGHDEMGRLSFGLGVFGQVRMECYEALLENAAEIRAMGDE